jgi:hypothetical protein
VDFLKAFKDAVRVSTPLVAVRTFDASSAIGVMQSAYGSKAEKQGQILWDVLNGCRPLNDKGQKELDILVAGEDGGLSATVMLENVLWFMGKKWKAKNADRQDNVVFISNAHLFMTKEKPAVLQGIWNLRNILKANGHMLVLLMAPGTQLPPELANDVLVIEEPLPTREELGELVVKHFGMVQGTPPEGMVLERMKDALIGLPMFGADQSIAMNLSGKTKALDMKGLWDKKKEMISQTRGMALYSGNSTLENIGGSAQVIEYYRAFFEGPKRPTLILFMDEVEKMFAGTGNADGHKGELAGYFQSWCEDNHIMGGAFVGIPGCGKTEIAKGLSGTFEIPLITFDIAEMQDKHVGESGALLRAACMRALAIAGKDGRILLLGTSNGLDNLPLGLRRRFEHAPMFFFDVPSRKEKNDIWQIQLKAHGLDPKQTIPEDMGWTGAEIRNCCSKAEALGMTVAQAHKWVIPVTRAEAHRIDNIRKRASGTMLSASVEGPYQFDESTKEVFDNEVVEQGTSKRRIKG